MRWDSDILCDACWDGIFRSTNHIPLELSGVDATEVWLEYSDIVQGVMHQIKFGGGRHLAAALGRRMARQKTKPQVDIITPVPLSRRRQYARGYNQAQEIARGMSAVWHIPMADVIQRPKQGRSQAQLDRVGRLHQTVNRYTCRHWLAGARVLLVDDTCTTGATLNACAEQLYLCGAQYVEGWAAAKGQ